MQTFLPYKSFVESALCLDRRRLGKQRVEAMQILKTLLGQSIGWASHPAVRMWRGHEHSLWRYAVICCFEWKKRGYDSTKVDATLADLAERYGLCEIEARDNPPPWLGDWRLHASHRSNLLRKDLGHYSRFGWKEEPGLEYVWPVTKEDV